MRRVSDTARAFAVSKSTCFNVLERWLSKEAVLTDARIAQWRLEAKLVKPGAAARRCHSRRSVLLQAVQPLVDTHRLIAPAAVLMVVAHTLPANILSALQ